LSGGRRACVRNAARAVPAIRFCSHTREARMTQLIWNGLFVGSFYALIALGYSMVYGIIKLLNFAHGDIYMLGAFIGFAVLSSFGGITASMSII
jgi:branched-subunit amino acid ABC-type transport system permease component